MKKKLLSGACGLLIVLGTAGSVTAEEAQMEEGCFDFTLSCGVSGTACGDNTLELIDLILEVDDAICG
jgi:hypothetical protein